MHRFPHLCALAVLLAGCASAPSNPMSFFVTSTGSGKGADLGGLAGADAHCEKLAASVGAGGKGWRAYLSTTGATGVNARDRIGSGPWVNAKGVVIASDVASLHGKNNLSKQTALTEKGEVINGRGDTPNMHDMLTGSTSDGRAVADAIGARPAVKRGRMVNRLTGDPSEQLHERHDASDFDTKTQDKIGPKA